MSPVPYSEIAQLAKQAPETWVVLRKKQTSANLVTQIRRGDKPDLDPRRFEAKSAAYRTVDEEGSSKTYYDIEIRYIPEDNPQDEGVVEEEERFTIEQLMAALSHPEVRDAIRNVLQGSIYETSSGTEA